MFVVYRIEGLPLASTTQHIIQFHKFLLCKFSLHILYMPRLSKVLKVSIPVVSQNYIKKENIVILSTSFVHDVITPDSHVFFVSHFSKPYLNLDKIFMCYIKCTFAYFEVSGSTYYRLNYLLLGQTS